MFYYINKCNSMLCIESGNKYVILHGVFYMLIEVYHDYI